ncbi:MAG TPA: hypothetical protein VGK25_07855, partial [Ignavibacteria bacterium]
KKKVKDEHGNIVSAWLCLNFSAVEDSSLEQMSATLNDLSVLKANFIKSPYYSDESWAMFESVNNELKIIFQFLQEIRFENYWNNEIKPVIEKKITEIQPGLPAYDVVGNVEYYMGSRLPSNKITVYILYFTKPHGIRITGMRFLTAVDWPFEILIRTASHEMMHPPYDYSNDEELRNLIESFKKDEFLMDKVLNHNPSFGYNTLDGLFEEDCVQALDQIINEKFNIAKGAKKRWKESDDGIHVLAIALYQIMKDENYNIKKEKFRDFLLRVVNNGTLMPGSVENYYDKFYR